ncbi:MAG: hypothetical protein CM15mV68_360 [uncultured marine virus]|nr:MAG: hypothetical protein CM15mV68_360 [uncultured marine virus]
MMQRRIQEADRYNADMKEAQEQFDAFVGLVGEGNMDKAAQIMKVLVVQNKDKNF